MDGWLDGWEGNGEKEKERALHNLKYLRHILKSCGNLVRKHFGVMLCVMCVYKRR